MQAGKQRRGVDRGHKALLAPGTNQVLITKLCYMTVAGVITLGEELVFGWNFVVESIAAMSHHLNSRSPMVLCMLDHQNQTYRNIDNMADYSHKDPM